MNTLTKVAAGRYTYRGFTIVRATWIRSSPWVIKHELLRGLHYADEWGPDEIGDGGGLKRSAAATVKVIEQHQQQGSHQ